MNHEHDTTQRQGSESMQAEIGTLVIGLSEVVTAALGVGVSMTRIAAKVTSPEASAVDVKSDGPIPDMVHYSATTVSNILNLITSAAGISTQPAPQSTTPSAAESSVRAETTTARLPHVRRGSTLRIPLSIENPTSAPMVAMSFTCLEMLPAVANTDYPLDTSSVSFQPATLNIAPKDFEKLTVFIDTTPLTTTGLYQVRIGLNTGLFETELQFEVIPAENET